MTSITEFVTTHETIIRLSFFFGILIIMATWELLAPRRELTISKPLRWANNLGIAFLNSFILRLVFPAAAVGVALFANQQNWGLLSYYQVPVSIAILISIITLDLVIYLQHVMVHAVPILWRLHQVHHADPDFDVTTGTRFHPLEIILSMLIKFAVIIILGPPVIAVIVFEILLNATAMFNHSNIRLARPIDRVLRYFIVSPDMHRVHHSINHDEANSNFGFNFPWWDRLFGTYKAQPREGHKNMVFGIHQYQKPAHVSWLPGMLILPFRGKVSEYAINRRYQSANNEN